MHKCLVVDDYNQCQCYDRRVEVTHKIVSYYGAYGLVLIGKISQG